MRISLSTTTEEGRGQVELLVRKVRPSKRPYFSYVAPVQNALS